jgi:hypothetical protein
MINETAEHKRAHQLIDPVDRRRQWMALAGAAYAATRRLTGWRRNHASDTAARAIARPYRTYVGENLGSGPEVERVNIRFAPPPSRPRLPDGEV